MFDANQLIHPTDVTYSWIFENLHGKDKQWDQWWKEYGVTSAKNEEISGAGFLSNVSRVKVFFGDDSRVFSVILKVPTIEHARNFKEEEALTEFEDSLLFYHNQEIKFYLHFAKYCDALYFPKMYAYIESCKEKRIHGRIIVEDVGHLGVLPNTLKGCSLKQCEEVIKTLAKFHAFTACFLNTELILSIVKIKDQPHSYEIPPSLYELEPFFNQHKDVLQKMAVKYDTPCYNAHYKFNVTPIMAHGDCWGNNMFFERRPDGSCGDKLFTLFDWQVTKIGTGLCDLSRFLCTTASYEVLEEHLDHLLELYYDTLVSSMKEKGRQAPYSLKKCKQMFRYEFPYEFHFSILVLPLLSERTNDEKIRDGVRRRLRAGYFMAEQCAKEFENF
ncbi:unnamed protein product [Bursaphelenchus okinawaensis]|uniref:CHK kinase-like domain-containing protein n=1 Tax=Bursaphelenchus okinawaensis TaxID=465554 RepID=A0A811KUM5_9BILA|nr:unnamed protein product [Bursaphelenchus okinawaensis]CAG9111021.1 unnamed protein product [Bursaphelenchus okinawaensis]